MPNETKAGSTSLCEELKALTREWDRHNLNPVTVEQGVVEQWYAKIRERLGAPEDNAAGAEDLDRAF